MGFTCSWELLFHDGQLVLKKSTFANEHFHHLNELMLMFTELSFKWFLDQLDQDHLHTVLICEICPLIVVGRITEIRWQINHTNVINQIPLSFVFQKSHHCFLIEQFVVYFWIVDIQWEKSENNFDKSQSESWELLNVLGVSTLVLCIEHRCRVIEKSFHFHEFLGI